MSTRIVAVFDDRRTAGLAQRRLIAAGIPAGCITSSIPLTDDAIAAEAPGESFQRQPGQSAQSNESARYAESVRAGVLSLSVDLRAGAERETAHSVLASSGARSVSEQPPAE